MELNRVPECRSVTEQYRSIGALERDRTMTDVASTYVVPSLRRT